MASTKRRRKKKLIKEVVSILYGQSRPSEGYKRYIICREFGWDYYTYERQPDWFIDEILLIMNQENQKHKSEMDKVSNKVPKR